jgi:hypothetical protein
MTTIAHVISRATGTEIDVDSLSAVLIFSGIGLAVSLLAVTAYGLDLSAGFVYTSSDHRRSLCLRRARRRQLAGNASGTTGRAASSRRPHASMS